MNPKLLFDKETMRQLGYRAVDMIINHIEDLPEKNATKQKTRTELEAIFREEMPKEGMDPMELLNLAEKEIKQYANWVVVAPAKLGIINFQYRPLNQSA